MCDRVVLKTSGIEESIRLSPIGRQKHTAFIIGFAWFQVYDQHQAIILKFLFHLGRLCFDGAELED